MLTLSRHLVARHVLFFAGGLLLFLLVGAIVEMLVHLEELVDQRERSGGALRWLALRVPARYAAAAVPAASFAAVFLCVGLAARARETTALFACGVSPFRIAAPLLACAGALSVASFVFNETWLLDARREVAALESPAAGAPEVFWYHSGDRLYNVGGREAEGRLRDVAVFELGPRGRLRSATHAPEARDTGAGWQLSGSVRHDFDPRAPERPAAVRRLGESLLPAGPGLVPASDLAGRPGGEDLHARLAHASAVWVFALLALSLGLRVGPGRGLGRLALVGAAALLVFHGADAAARLAVRDGLLTAQAGAWLAPLLLAGAALLALHRAPR